MSDDVKAELIKRTREWLEECVRVATRNGVPEEADLEAFILAHVDGEQARQDAAVAAAREEQRQACALVAAHWAREAGLAYGEPSHLFDAVMAAPLAATPLADELERSWQETARMVDRAEKAEAERDALRAQLAAVRKVAEEMDADTFDGDGATAAAGAQILAAMDGAKP